MCGLKENENSALFAVRKTESYTNKKKSWNQLTVWFFTVKGNFREVWTDALKQPFDKIEDSGFLHAALIPPGPDLHPIDIKVLNFLGIK